MEDNRPDALTTDRLAQRTGVPVRTTVAKRGATAEETALMNRLARLSAAEREQIVDEFKEEVFGGLDIDPQLRDRASIWWARQVVRTVAEAREQ